MADSADNPPRCLGCWYVLTGLEGNRCPECGRAFHLDIPDSYTTRPPFLFWRFWLPALMLAVASGVFTFAMLLSFGSTGLATTVATPIMIGAIVGYRCRLRSFLSVLLMIVTFIGLLSALVLLDFAGLLCAVIAFLVTGAPLIVGWLLGFILRSWLKGSTFGQRSYLPVIIMMFLPAGTAIVEAGIGYKPVAESVRTSMSLPMPPAAAWDGLSFYEDLPQERPWLLRWAGPVPVRTAIRGMTRTCFYEKGYIVKRVTEIKPPRRLAFVITEQRLGEENVVRIMGGSFEFEPRGDQHTEVTLTTRYLSNLRPRFCWRPFEHFVTRSVHEHVLAGMAGADHGPAQLAQSAAEQTAE
jgi:hypothetical protein